MAKTKTYEQIAKQIELLQQQAEAIKRKESAGVIARIKEAIAHYGLTAEDLGLKPAVARKSVKAAAGTGAKRGRKPGRKGAKRPSVIRYRNAAGQSWTGMGRKPGWIIAGLAAGKSLADFAVEPGSSSAS